MERKVFFLTLVIAWLYGAAIHAQMLPATAEQQKVMLEKIMAASEKMESLICDFEQTKELSLLSEKMISNGKMYYRKNSRLRWEYLTPYNYAFVVNDKKILLQTESGRNVIDIKSNRFFQEIVKIMINGVNGSGLTDLKNFTGSYYRSDKKWEVVLAPVKKEMKQMFSCIRLTFNVDDFTVDNVEMEERNGDRTNIRLTGKKQNVQIEDRRFHID
ncbi:MAG: outer membrane lipoprotein carrier protein LolA [Tannerella sp.]|jgi:outer membrane lipoprotein-sorting protein|nr:outer membrane lipoprotein carrier protein LolA [Tannerella sp.]